MTSSVDIAELSQTQDRFREGRKTSAQDLQLADAMKFSTIFRAQVDTAQQGFEQVMDAARQRMQADKALDKSQASDPTAHKAAATRNDAVQLK